MRRYVSTELDRRRAAREQQVAAAVAEPSRNLQRELAEKIVKALLNNPVAANSAQYERIVAAIEEYTQAIKAEVN